MSAAASVGNSTFQKEYEWQIFYNCHSLAMGNLRNYDVDGNGNGNGNVKKR